MSVTYPTCLVLLVGQTLVRLLAKSFSYNRGRGRETYEIIRQSQWSQISSVSGIAVDITLAGATGERRRSLLCWGWRHRYCFGDGDNDQLGCWQEVERDWGILAGNLNW